MRHSVFATAAAMAGFLLLAGCAPQETPAQRQREANTAAGKVGQAAHKVSVEADKAGRVLAKELRKEAHEAHEGWRADAGKDKK